MRTIFEIFEENGIKHNINLKDWLESEDFIFISELDPKILDQMTAEEICSTDGFYNTDNLNAVMFLLENRKVSLKGFNLLMNKDFYYSATNAQRTQDFFMLCQEFILENKIDVAKEYIRNLNMYKAFSSMLEKFNYLDHYAILKNVDLDEALKKEAFVSLLFGFKNDYVNHIKYIKENFNKIAEVYFNEKNIWKISNTTRYMEISYNPFTPTNKILLNNFTLDELIKLGNQTLIEMLFDNNVKEHKFEDAKIIVESIKDKFPQLHEKFTIDQEYRKYFNLYTKEIDIENLTPESFEVFLDNNDETVRNRLISDINIHKILNKDGLFYDYNKHIYYNEYTLEVLNFYIDKIIETEGDTNYKWNSTVHNTLYTVLELSKRYDWAIDSFIKCFYSKIFKDIIIKFVEDNGDLKILNYIANISPSTVKNDFNHEKLLNKVIYTTKFSKD